MSGLQLAAAYAFATRTECHCSSGDDVAAIGQFLAGEVGDGDVAAVRRALRKFIKPQFFYELIAHSHDIEDPFDPIVVEAYWIGNSRLDYVSQFAICEMAHGYANLNPLQQKELDYALKMIVCQRVCPHHNLQVYASFINSASEISGPALGVLQEGCDNCRICSGQVVNVMKEDVTVKYQPLMFLDGGAISIGDARQKSIKRGFLADVKPGDIVSIHLSMGIQILEPCQVENLRKYNDLSLEAINSRR